MIAALKIIHFLSFAAGIGVSTANIVIGGRVATFDAQTLGKVRQVQNRLAMIGAAAILLLWITGIWMFVAIYGASAAWLGFAFQLKIAAVILLTLSMGAIHVLVARARRAGTPPPERPIAALGKVILLTAVLAVVCAVIVFG